ncbi:hypothetical protein ACYSNV_04880 [Myroides sp. LJL119]
MKIRKISFLILATLLGLNVIGQDLTHMIPQQVKFVVSINQKAILEKGSVELLNELFEKSKFFKQQDSKNNHLKITDLGIDLNKQAYVYYQSTDSINLTAMLFSVDKNKENLQNILESFQVIEPIGDYTVLENQDKDMRVAYNQKAILFVKSQVNYNYFYNQEISQQDDLTWQAYDFDQNQDQYQSTYDYDYQEDSESWTKQEDQDYKSIAQDNKTNSLEESQEVVIMESDFNEYQSQEQYDDDDQVNHYLPVIDTYAKNDSLALALTQQWFDQFFPELLNPKQSFANPKELMLNKSDHLIRMQVTNIDDIYKDILPMDMINMPYGFDMDNMKYGYKKANFDLWVKGNLLELDTNFTMDKDLATSVVNMYNGKFNPKFKKYIPKDHIAYLAFNFNMQAYLQELPQIISQRYGQMFPENADLFALIATSIDIAFDQKALASVLPGDMVVFLNDFAQTTVSYIDYEYDQDYNFTQVEKTKQEYLPDFLLVASSKDQRLFKMGLDYALSQGKVTTQGEMYKIPASESSNAMYVLFKEDMIFLATNFQQITQIKNNTFQADFNKEIKKQFAGKWGVNTALQTPKVTGVLKQLDIPVSSELSNIVNDLPYYGALQFKSGIAKNKSVYARVSLKMPKDNKNALAYILKQITQSIQ